MVGRQCKLETMVLKMNDKMPTLRKIKRAASRYTSQRFCSTFNFAQHTKPTHHPTTIFDERPKTKYLTLKPIFIE
jgi:hypothetical protein